MIKEPGDCKDMEDAGLIQRGQLPRPHQLIIARCNIGPELPDLCNLFREAGISGFFFFFFFWAVRGLSCSMWGPVPWPGIERTRAPCIGSAES